MVRDRAILSAVKGHFPLLSLDRAPQRYRASHHFRRDSRPVCRSTWGTSGEEAQAGTTVVHDDGGAPRLLQVYASKIGDCLQLGAPPQLSRSPPSRFQSSTCQPVASYPDRKPRLRKPLPVTDTGQWIMIHRQHPAFRICLPAKTHPGVSRMWNCRNF